MRNLSLKAFISFPFNVRANTNLTLFDYLIAWLTMQNGGKTIFSSCFRRRKCLHLGFHYLWR